MSGGGNAAERAVVALKELNIPPVRMSCYRDYEVINVREDQALGDGWVEGGDIDDEQQR